MDKERLHLDDMDKRILKSLIINPRKSSRQLSKEVKASHQTILSRLKRLEESKVIQGYTTVVDWDKLGYPLRSMFLVRCGKLEPKNFDSIEKYLNGDNCFIQYGALHGEYDFFVIGQFRTQQELFDKSAELRALLSKQTDMKEFGCHAISKLKHKQNQDI
jgi:DNA-binding Lrp family transcriptional regulator